MLSQVKSFFFGKERKAYGTLIFEALKEGNETLVKELCSEAEVEKKDITMALCEYIENYDPQNKETIIKRINLLIDIGKEKDNSEKEKREGEFLNIFVNNTTPLIRAVQTWDIDIVQLLLDRGANVNETFHKGEAINSALDEACKCKYDSKKEQRRNIIKLLISKGANVNGHLYYSPFAKASYQPCWLLNDETIEVMKYLMREDKFELSIKDEKELRNLLEKKENSRYKDFILQMIAVVKERMNKKPDGGRNYLNRRHHLSRHLNRIKKSHEKKSGRSKVHRQNHHVRSSRKNANIEAEIIEKTGKSFENILRKVLSEF